MRVDRTHPGLVRLVQLQHGVVSRRQVLELGGTDSDIERMLRRRDLRTVHRGVYVNHTGPLTPKQREWAAVLAVWPAAVTLETALPGLTAPTIHLAIHDRRSAPPPPGAAVHRMAHFDARVNTSCDPPSVIREHALIDLMSSRVRADDVAGAFDALARVVRYTNPARILTFLGERQRLPGRRTIEGLVTDARDGVCSVLERGYLHRVERPHGLPRGDRQAPSLATGRRTDKDVRYSRYGLIVELDGRAFHDDPRARDADAARDLAELAVSTATTARVTYGMVFRDQCRTAGWIARLLRRQGWTDPYERCPLCPTHHAGANPRDA